MAATLLGDLTAHVQRLAEVEYKQEKELAPIPHHLMEERTAAAWDPLHLPENAILIRVKVNILSLSLSLSLSNENI